MYTAGSCLVIFSTNVVHLQAAARHRCSYLINMHSTEFLLQHGDEQWLKGVQHAPAKLQRLSEVNRILAHRPWLITTDHIQVNSSSTTMPCYCLQCLLTDSYQLMDNFFVTVVNARLFQFSITSLFVVTVLSTISKLSQQQSHSDSYGYFHPVVV